MSKKRKQGWADAQAAHARGEKPKCSTTWDFLAEPGFYVIVFLVLMVISLATAAH